MKKLILITSGLIALCACSSTAKYADGQEPVPEVVHISLGFKDGIKPGDRIRALEKDCDPNGKFRACEFTTIGYLKVIKVEGKKSSLAQQEQKINIDENTYFEKDRTAENKKNKY